MKPRHAAALALVGWYLAAPPITGDMKTSWINFKAPLNEWTITESFDSKEDCMKALRGRDHLAAEAGKRGDHVPLICRLASTPDVYRRNYLSRGDELNRGDSAIDFDVVTELVFPTRAAYLAWRAALPKPGSGEQVVEDEEKFIDRSRTRASIIEERVTSG